MTDLKKRIKEDDLNAMPMSEVFQLVKDIESICNQTMEDLTIYSDNMKVIHRFIKNNMSA